MTIKNILVITPSLPYPITGAEQSDRANGLKQLARIFGEVRVITKITAWQTKEMIDEASEKLDVIFIPVTYKYSNKELSLALGLKKIFLKIKNPLFLDGAAMEYGEPEIIRVFREEIKKNKPDLIWCDYTYLWPLYKIAVQAGVPVFTRSINFEPIHFLQEEGLSPLNLVRSVSKLVSEYIVVKKSFAILAITPKEQKIYEKMGGNYVSNLPLRGLPELLAKSHFPRVKNKLEVVFMGSTYNVAHNRKALGFILKKIAPYFAKHHPEDFSFNITGGKIPLSMRKKAGSNVIFHGYVDNLNNFLTVMDVAVVPSFYGAGMQQKIFEPLVRGIPTITTKKGLADYPFIDGKDIFLAETPEDFARQLLRLKDYYLRKKISESCLNKAKEIFSQDNLDRTVLSVANKVFSGSN